MSCAAQSTPHIQYWSNLGKGWRVTQRMKRLYLTTDTIKQFLGCCYRPTMRAWYNLYTGAFEFKDCNFFNIEVILEHQEMIMNEVNRFKERRSWKDRGVLS